jgi:hypothetical protein
MDDSITVRRPVEGLRHAMPNETGTKARATRNSVAPRAIRPQ